MFVVHDEIGVVTALYHNLDAVEGLTGITVDTVPAPKSNGLLPVLKVNLADNTLYYDYETPPVSQSDTFADLEVRIEANESAILALLDIGL